MGGIRSVVGGVGLVAGVVTALIGLISFLAEASFADFVFRSGIGFLVMAGIALIFLVGVLFAPPSPPTQEVGPKPGAVQRSLTLAAFVVLCGLVGGLVVLAPFTWSEWKSGDVKVHEDIEGFGFGGLLMSILVLVVGWKGLVASLRQSTRSSRPCPRCGHSVEVGVMKCPYCEFNFWSIGREAG